MLYARPTLNYLFSAVNVQKVYMDEMERQNVDLTKMLDPKARWPKVMGLDGRMNTPGRDLLQVARRATTTDYKGRSTTKEVNVVRFCRHQ